MPLADFLLPEFDQEMAFTRRVLDRVPEAHLAWKPHAKSWSLGELATHVANIPGWVEPTMKHDALDMAAPDAPKPMQSVASRSELLALFDRGMQEARAALQEATDACLQGSWSLRMGDKVFFTLPRHAVMRTFVLNHGIHHRGQLEVYLRLKDVPLPSLYGPSADEGQM